MLTMFDNSLFNNTHGTSIGVFGLALAYYKIFDEIEKVKYFLHINIIVSTLLLIIGYQFIEEKIDWYNIGFPLYVIFIYFLVLFDYSKYKKMYRHYDFKLEKNEKDVL